MSDQRKTRLVNYSDFSRWKLKRGKKLRKKRLQEQQNLCKICQLPLNKDITWDHIIPISMGGSLTDEKNLQLTHLVCNREKSNKVDVDIQKK